MRDRPAFGRAEVAAGWPRLRDIPPVLLRSAGAVGLAATIVALVSSRVLFGSDDSPAEPEPVVLAASEASRPPSPPSTAFNVNAPLATGYFAPSTTQSLSGEEPAVAAVQTPAPAAPEPIAGPAPAPAAPEPIAGPAPAPVEPAAPAGGEAASRPGARIEAAMDVAATVEEPAPAPEEPSAEAVAPQAAPPSPPHSIDSTLAMIQPPDSESQAALEEAAARQLEELGLAVARIPLPRPDPPPQVRSTPRRTVRNSDWPAEPPPNCGTKHAYWRFVDRKAGTKEWYCK
jgi:hypothetical protein